MKDWWVWAALDYGADCLTRGVGGGGGGVSGLEDPHHLV